MLERSRMIRPANLIRHPFRCNIAHQMASSYILVEEITSEDNEDSLKDKKLSLNAFPAALICHGRYMVFPPNCLLHLPNQPEHIHTN